MKEIEYTCDNIGVEWIGSGVKATYDGNILLVDQYSKYKTACRYTAATVQFGETVIIKICGEGIHIQQKKDRLRGANSETAKAI